LLKTAQRPQFIPTNAPVAVRGDTAGVSVDENIIDGERSVPVAPLNVFSRARARGWRMVVHHGSAVGPTPPADGCVGGGTPRRAGRRAGRRCPPRRRGTSC